MVKCLQIQKSIESMSAEVVVRPSQRVQSKVQSAGHNRCIQNDSNGRYRTSGQGTGGSAPGGAGYGTAGKPTTSGNPAMGVNPTMRMEPAAGDEQGSNDHRAGSGVCDHNPGHHPHNHHRDRTCYSVQRGASGNAQGGGAGGGSAMMPQRTPSQGSDSSQGSDAGWGSDTRQGQDCDHGSSEHDI